MRGTTAITNTINKMTTDLQTVIDDVQVLLKTTGETPKKLFREAKPRFKKTLKHARKDVVKLEHDVARNVRKAARATDNYTRDHAWTVAGAVAGVGAGVGLLVGLLAGRRHPGLEREDH